MARPPDLAPLPSPPAGDGALLGVSVCIFRHGEILLVQRGKEPGRGSWAPVGGGIEPGETAEAAALREVAEETGVAIRLLGRVGLREIVLDPAVARRFGRPDRTRLEVFAARWIGQAPVAGDDAMDARFVALDRLGEMALIDGVLPWIRAAQRLADGAAPP